MELSLENINKIIEEKIIPVLKFHNGSCTVSSLDLDKKTLLIKLTGGCAGCPSSLITLYNGIIPIIQETFPDLEVELDI